MPAGHDAAPTPTVIGVISDTHGLVRPEALTALAGVRLILHAGDIGGAEVLAALNTVAPVTAVAGNSDSGPLARRLSATEVVEIRVASSSQLVHLYLLHDLGRLDLDAAAAGFSAVVSGHTHRPDVAHSSDGVLYLNPGSAGPLRGARPPSVARLTVHSDGRLSAEIVDLG